MVQFHQEIQHQYIQIFLCISVSLLSHYTHTKQIVQCLQGKLLIIIIYHEGALKDLSTVTINK